MGRNPGQLSHQRENFARVALFFLDLDGQREIMVRAQEFAVAADADAKARLWRLDLPARCA
jgi:hypothetical protein